MKEYNSRINYYIYNNRLIKKYHFNERKKRKFLFL